MPYESIIRHPLSVYSLNQEASLRGIHLQKPFLHIDSLGKAQFLLCLWDSLHDGDDDESEPSLPVLGWRLPNEEVVGLQEREIG